MQSADPRAVLRLQGPSKLPGEQYVEAEHGGHAEQVRPGQDVREAAVTLRTQDSGQQDAEGESDAQSGTLDQDVA